VSKHGFALRHIVFTGPGLEPAALSFVDGVNVVFGASDTGKSFIVKAMSYMLGARSKLPKIDERNGYDAAWLGLVLPSGREVTLYRSTKGGGIKLHEGLVTAAENNTGTVLAAAEGKKDETVSHYLLNEIGLADKQIVRNANADKETLSIRLLAPLFLVEEDLIISGRSPILYSGQHTEVTFEKNLFRLLLTGQDDSGVQTVMSKSTRTVVTNAKVEILDELIGQIDEQLGEGEIDRADLQRQIESVDASLASLHESLQSAQNEIDALVSERRTKTDTKLEFSTRLTELEVTLQRFASLDAVYRSDIARLEALEEGGFILSAMSGQECAVCGAPPSAQRHNHAADEIERSHAAAAAEARKIEREQRDLARTVASLTAESNGLRSAIGELNRSLVSIEQKIADARPKEAAARNDYEVFFSKKSDLERITSLLARRDALIVKKSQVEEKPPTPTPGDKMPVGIDGPTGYAFGKTVREILEIWRFPRAAEALFDLATSDVTIGGKERGDSGKGVKAILHAAVNVALLIYCRERNLPHPGIVVLDTPLLTYREPLGSRHGELSVDEVELKRTGLATHFYNHLASLEGLGQFVVIENADPPTDLDKTLPVQTFTANPDSGRYGFFPLKRTG
jgi:peptidoglycan hydrolase CwlO-like protein